MRIHALLLLSTVSLPAASTLVLSDPAGVSIPDGTPTGVLRSLTFTAPEQIITGISVDLALSAPDGESTFLGDLYVYLTDGTHLVTLLNRPGRDGSRPFGYGDEQGLDVTFQVGLGSDIHTYRETVTGDAATPLPGTLTGTFTPDGRLSDPGSVLTSDPRESTLSDFVGFSADRTFSLYAADFSTGGLHTIDSWSLTLTTVPEPSSTLLASLAPVILLTRRRR
ncbi:hypothetical protein [Roseibacillus ishigakijimensis]|uniref:PEP-CTERM protein-sorting domain-containing protein n=1 Tax=Roseibacillus ishigakijimensis TaxID=454146 RepID=A0A934RQV9_9BACT|nr:hypothetical protein [Roseibacillus ishigakijimensis]MBK1832605.1 hypothetical protein [Roseibacillus ishigakijimensis]